jgi:uncharacterized protein
MKLLADIIFKFRKTILVIIAVITVFFAYECTKLKVNSDTLSYLPKDDQAVALFNKVGDVFSGNDMAMVVVQSEEIFTKQNIEAIAKLSQDFKNIDGVSAVISLTNIIDIRKAEDGTAEVGKLIDPYDLPKDAAGYEAVKKYALSKEFYLGRLITPDSKYSLITVRIAPQSNKAEVAKKIKETAYKDPLPFKVYLGGNPVMMSELSEIIFNDLRFLIPIVSLLIIVVLYFSFKTLRGVLVPFVSVGISTIWTLGLMSFLGKPLSVISDVIPVLLIAIGTAPAIHILSKYDEHPEKMYGNSDENVKTAFREVGLRVILTELTIIFGFSSFIFGSYLIMIQEFGIFTSIGTFFVLFISTLCIPAFLTFLSVKTKHADKDTAPAKNRITKLMDKLSAFVMKEEKLIIAAFLLILIISLAGIPKIERKVDMVEYFDKGTGVRAAESLLHDNFGGSRPLQVLASGDIQSPVVLREINRFSKFIASMDEVNNPNSITDMVNELNDVMDDKKTVPDTKDKVTNLWFLIEGQELLPQLVNEDKTEALLQAMISTRDMKKTNGIISAVDNYIAALDTAAVSTAVRDLAISERAGVYSMFAGRITDEIIWDSMRYNKGKTVDRKSVENILYQKYIDPAINGRSIKKIDVSAALKDVLAALPEATGQSNFAVASIKNDIAQVNDEFISLPLGYYQKLSIASKIPAEPVSFSFAQSGIHIIYKHLGDSLISSQIQSFLIALAFIYILLILQTGSIIGGFISMVPIVVTVIMNFGLMGYTGIALDVATVLAASVALGIGIDYSIHFTMRFRSYYVEGHPGEALEKTLETTGKAILINMISVTIGFLTLVFSHLVPLRQFGILVAVTMISSGIGAVTLLPALTLITNARFVGAGAKLLKKMKERYTKKRVN